jgi:hypothetical protein
MYSTQHLGQVDKRLRDNTDYFYICKKRIAKDGNLYIMQTLITYDGGHKKLMLPAKEVFDLYDTHEIVNPFDNDTKTTPKQKTK